MEVSEGKEQKVLFWDTVPPAFPCFLPLHALTWQAERHTQGCALLAGQRVASARIKAIPVNLEKEHQEKVPLICRGGRDRGREV